MKPEFLYLYAGAITEMVGLLTLMTNPGTVLPYLDLGFEIPVLFLSASIQGAGLFAAGTTITLYSVYMMR